MVITKDDAAQFFAIAVTSLQPDLHSAHAEAAASAMFDSQPAERPALHLLQCAHVRSTPTPSALRAAIACIHAHTHAYRQPHYSQQNESSW